MHACPAQSCCCCCCTIGCYTVVGGHKLYLHIIIVVDSYSLNNRAVLPPRLGCCGKELATRVRAQQQQRQLGKGSTSFAVGASEKDRLRTRIH